MVKLNQRRQDSWTHEEDTLLATTVLDYIKNGNTQLNAFEAVANELGRTASACGFRWNATLRKQYEEQIALAKKKCREKPLVQRVSHDEGDWDLKKVIEILKEINEDLMNTSWNDDHYNELIKLRKENAQLKDRIEKQKNAYHHIQSVLKGIQTQEIEQ